MFKKCIYPKTKRVKCDMNLIEVTEKLDGSNLCIFKKDDVLYIAQRNTIMSFDEVEDNKSKLYKGLYQWLIDNYDALSNIINNRVVCGEWIGMGKLKYSVDEFDKRFYMFAEADIDDNFNLYNIHYKHEFFKYPFENSEIPKCIGIVPEVCQLPYIPNKDKLDILYDKYCNKVCRDVEGFVINYHDHIEKYVRMKNGKLQEHFDRGE